MSNIRIVLANSSLAGYPEAGGLWIYFLQYFLGLYELGHDVLWLEILKSTGDDTKDQQLINTFFKRMQIYGLEDRCILLLYDNGIPSLENSVSYFKSKVEIKEIFSSTDLLWNFANALKHPLLSYFKRRIFLDGDPGHLQVSALSWDIGQNDHDVFLTVGSKLGDPDCEVPTLGLIWHSFPPIVYLPMWKVTPDPGLSAPFTSITQWNWDEIWLGDRVLSIGKRYAYMKYIELPKRTSRKFELAANIHPDDDTGDREILQDYNWNLVHPHEVAGSPSAYQEYIQKSRAELCCPKPIFTELKTGWFSDRSACYLASGRPVLMEETGFSDHFPVGKGVIVFQNIEEAVAGVAEIDSNYQLHSKAARDFAEEFLDSRKCLNAMLDACNA
jgi:hypothetical protein